MTIRALEFYSGIGGLHRSLQISDIDATVVRAFDWDQTSCRAYEANYGPGIVEKVDISTITASHLVELNAPLWLLSPSCQPYTVLNPNAKGAHDPRAKSFLHLVQHVIPDLARTGHEPKWILVENVAGFESSSTREMFLETLHDCDYSTLELLLNPLQFGIPNSRLRYYLLAKQYPGTFASASDENDPRTIWRHIPGHGNPWKDTRDDCDATHLRAYLDPEPCTETELAYKIPDRVLLKWGRLFDIVLPSSRRSCCFTRGYTQLVERAGSILQMNEELDVSISRSPLWLCAQAIEQTTETFDAFLSLQKQTSSRTHESNQLPEEALLGILAPLRLRYFSPSELLRLLHFESPTEPSSNGNSMPTFKWPVDVSRRSKYRLLGNSVNVDVARRLVNYLFEGDDLVL